MTQEIKIAIEDIESSEKAEEEEIEKNIGNPRDSPDNVIYKKKKPKKQKVGVKKTPANK